MLKKSKLLICLSIVFSVLGAFFYGGGSASASDVSSLIKELMIKASYQGVYRCYKHQFLKTKFKLGDYVGVWSLVDDKKDSGNEFALFVTGAKSASYQMKSSALSCKSLFQGGKENKNVFKANGQSEPSTSDLPALQKTLSSMGYGIIVSPETQKTNCYYMNFTLGGKAGKTNSVCQDSNGKISTEGQGTTFQGKNKRTGQVYYEVSDMDDTYLCLRAPSSGVNKYCNNQTWELSSDGKQTNFTPLKINKTGLRDFSLNACGYGDKSSGISTEGMNCKDTGGFGTLVFADVGNDTQAKEAAPIANNEAYYSDGATMSKSAVSYLSNQLFTNGGRKAGGHGFGVTELEERYLYQWYLTHIFNFKVNCKSNVQSAGYNGVVYWLPFQSGNKAKKCMYKTDLDEYNLSNTSVNGVDGNGFFVKGARLKGAETLINKLAETKDKTYSEAEIKAIDEAVKIGENDVDPEGKANCVKNGNSSGLNWLVCSVIDWMSSASNSVFNDVVEPALSVKSNELFGEGEKSGDAVKGAWGTFQGIANTIFVVLFLVVIFSQLTGVGIDNYGIKKILPKLIVVAVMVNLSYILCVLAVDLSNILGNGFQSMFNELADQLGGGSKDIMVGDDSITVASGTGLAGLSILTAVVGGGVLLWMQPAIILSLLVSAVGVIISIFFLFILLSIREAAIVVLVVVSPIAVVMYALPNTKGIFDKWWKFFEGLLLVYPISGLLVGAGNYVSKLMLEADMATGFGVFAAIIVSVAPIFFIPTVLKSSFAAMGRIGAGLAGIGQAISGGATKKIHENEGFQLAQAKMAAAEGPGGIRRKFFDKMPGVLGKNAYARSRMRYNKMLKDQGAYNAAVQEDYLLQTQANNEMENLVASGDINNSGKLESGLETALMNNDRAKIIAYTDALSAKGDGGRMAVKNAYDSAVSSGELSDAAAKTFANNIMANHAIDYKNNDRTMFEVVKGINSASDSELSVRVQTTGSYLTSAKKAELAGKLSRDSLGTMDDRTFGEIFGGYDLNGKFTRASDAVLPSGLSTEMRAQVVKNAKEALDYTNVKGERRAVLENIVNNNRDVFEGAGDTGSAGPRLRADLASGGAAGRNFTAGASGEGAEGDNGPGELIIDPRAADEAFRNGRESGEFRLPK